MPYTTGLCSIGCHEGLSPANFRGQALPTCKAIEQCTCDCHRVFNEMFKVSEMDRIPVDNSKYIPDKPVLVMPTINELVTERLSKDDTIVIEDPAPEIVPRRVIRQYGNTPSGRAKTGQLEDEVNKVCSDWSVDAPSELCTPKYISETIAREVGIKAPSVGAIHAVFERWAKMGYATVGTKPARFVGYTPEGIELGLEGCKQKFKRVSKRHV